MRRTIATALAVVGVVGVVLVGFFVVLAASIAQTDDIVGVDVNGDALTDLALTGVNGWSTVPVARSDGGGTFTVTNNGVGPFGSWASTPGVKILPGDYDGDGRTDVALTGVDGWGTVPVATSNGNGSFSVTDIGVPNFPIWSSTAGVKILPGDYDGDGRTDLALTGVSGWSTVPVASSDGDGSFTVTNKSASGVPTWSTASNAKALTGDFNGDGSTDLAVTGASGWSTIPVGRATGYGSCTVSNQPVRGFPLGSSAAGATVVTGDFNGDGESDLAVTGASGWGSIPVAFSTGYGSFVVTNSAVSNFGGWAAAPGAVVVTTPMTAAH